LNGTFGSADAASLEGWDTMPISFDAFKASQDAAAASNGGVRRPAAFSDETHQLFDLPSESASLAAVQSGVKTGGCSANGAAAAAHPNPERTAAAMHVTSGGGNDDVHTKEEGVETNGGREEAEEELEGQEEEEEEGDSSSEGAEDCEWFSDSDVEPEAGAADNGGEYDDSSAESSDWSDGGLWSDPDPDDDDDGGSDGKRSGGKSKRGKGNNSNSSNSGNGNGGGGGDPTELLEAVRSGDAPAVEAILKSAGKGCHSRVSDIVSQSTGCCSIGVSNAK
jgi:hypothetical protein